MASDLTLYDSTGNPVVLDGDTAKQALNGIGWDQTWQDVTANRAINTEYVNDTGRPIQVYVRATAESEGYTLSLVVDGISIGGVMSDGQYKKVYVIGTIVPAGATYEATISVSVTNLVWAELR